MYMGGDVNKRFIDYLENYAFIASGNRQENAVKFTFLGYNNSRFDNFILLDELSKRDY